jgi:hypothetical protein
MTGFRTFISRGEARMPMVVCRSPSCFTSAWTTVVQARKRLQVMPEIVTRILPNFTLSRHLTRKLRIKKEPRLQSTNQFMIQAARSGIKSFGTALLTLTVRYGANEKSLVAGLERGKFEADLLCGGLQSQLKPFEGVNAQQ